MLDKIEFQPKSTRLDKARHLEAVQCNSQSRETALNANALNNRHCPYF